MQSNECCLWTSRKDLIPLESGSRKQPPNILIKINSINQQKKTLCNRIPPNWYHQCGDTWPETWIIIVLGVIIDQIHTLETVFFKDIQKSSPRDFISLLLSIYMSWYQNIVWWQSKESLNETRHVLVYSYPSLLCQLCGNIAAR